MIKLIAQARHIIRFKTLIIKIQEIARSASAVVTIDIYLRIMKWEAV